MMYIYYIARWEMNISKIKFDSCREQKLFDSEILKAKLSQIDFL